MLLNDIYLSIKKQVKESYSIKELILNGGFTGVVLDNQQMGIAMNVRSGTTSNVQTREFLQNLIGKKDLFSLLLRTCLNRFTAR